MSVKQTIVECLTVLGVNVEHFQNAESVEQEFSAIKKLYFQRVLIAHPDKGGDAAVFREIQENWESLRDLYDKGKVHATGFGHYFSQEGSKKQTENRDSHTKAFDGRPTPSWEWFAEASGEPVPTYRVEIAKSGRSACNQKAQTPKGNENKHCHHTSELIEKDEIRFGSIEELSGSCKFISVNIPLNFVPLPRS
jgi:curved DNA-binding protein CbpA